MRDIFFPKMIKRVIFFLNLRFAETRLKVYLPCQPPAIIGEFVYDLALAAETAVTPVFQIHKYHQTQFG